MDLESKRKEIKKRYFSTGGLVIVSILGIVGIFMVLLSGIFNIESMDMLYDCISKNGIMIIFGLFFFLICLYCWILYFLNVIILPKKEILHLYENKQGEIYFINKKGKKFIYEKNDIKENRFYYVLKTHDYIYEVLEETSATWIPKEKKSYWLNFYSPVGNYEDIFLLPIVYVILLPGLFSFFMSKGYERIYGLILSIIPFYTIIYDLIYKIKLKKSGSDAIYGKGFYASFEILRNVISVILVVVLCTILISIFFSLSDFTSKLIFSPFLSCGLCSAGFVLSKIFKKYELANIFFKGYIVIFLIYWFGFLSFWTIGIIKQENNFMYALFSVPFWIAGFFMIYKYFIKNK